MFLNREKTLAPGGPHAGGPRADGGARRGRDTLLPYFDGERTPDLPHATGVLSGLTTTNATAENLAWAAVEGVLASLASVAELLTGYGVDPSAT
jgi:xylulokinase